MKTVPESGYCFEVSPEEAGGRPDQLSSQWGLDKYRAKALAKMLSSGVLNSEEYDMTYRELQKKAEVFIRGAQKRGKWKEVSFYKKLLGHYEDIKRNVVVR